MAILRGGDRMAEARGNATLVAGSALVLPSRDGLVIVVAIRLGGGSLELVHGDNSCRSELDETAPNGVARQFDAVTHTELLEHVARWRSTDSNPWRALTAPAAAPTRVPT